MRTQELKISSIEIPNKFHRGRGDDIRGILASISESGLKYPVHVLKHGSKFILIDGTRRIRVFRRLDKKTIPAIVEVYKKSSRFTSPYAYADYLRLIIDSKRQDLLPSQRSRFVNMLLSEYKMSQEEVRSALGINAGELRTIMKIRDCVKEMQILFDKGQFPLSLASRLASLTQSAQNTLIGRFRDDREPKFKDIYNFINGLPKENFVNPKRVKRINRNTKDGIVKRLLESRERHSYMQGEIFRLRQFVGAARPVVKRILGTRSLCKRLGVVMTRRLEEFAKQTGI